MASNKLNLERIMASDDCIFGKLYFNNDFFCFTLELPDRNNEEDISCIPRGFYHCVKTISPKFGTTFMIKDVPNRHNILFHWGNYPKDTKGCVLLGESMHISSNMVTNSKVIFEKFMKQLGDADSFDLSIYNKKDANDEKKVA